MADATVHPRTRTIARIVGPYLVVTAAMLVARRASLPKLFPAFMQDAPLVLAAGAFALIAGLSLLAVHRRWRGAAAIVVSLVAALTALKGAMLMVAPSLGAELSAEVVRAPAILSIVAVIVLLAGLWLTVVGWRSAPGPEAVSP